MPAMFLLTSGIVWIVCAAVIIRAAVRSRHHSDALRTGRIGVGMLYLVGGAAANLLFLVFGEDYAGFAEGSTIAFVRHTRGTLVVPNHYAWISLLSAGAALPFETAAEEETPGAAAEAMAVGSASVSGALPACSRAGPPSRR